MAQKNVAKKEKKKKESGIRVVAYDKNWEPMTEEKWQRVRDRYTEVMVQWVREGIITVEEGKKVTIC